MEVLATVNGLAVPTPLYGMSLCAGYDGLGLGIKLALPGYRTVVAVENEAYPAAVLVTRQQEGSLPPFPIWDSLESFDGRRWRGYVDIVHAGVPCQPWSVAGRHQGTRDERWIWPDIYRIIREVEPEFVFLEEVRGFIRGGLGLVLSDLADSGYRFAYDIFSAAAVGASHRRQRIFILAVADTGQLPTGRSAATSKAAGRRTQGGSAGRSNILGNTKRTGLALRQGKRHDDGAECATIKRAGLPLFPPGPAEWERWAAVLAERSDLTPALEPNVRVLDDGLATIVGTTPRADWLRALGNGVVPAQACRALQELLRQIL